VGLRRGVRLRSDVGQHSDVGSATVEFALALPAVVAVLALGLGTVGWTLAAARAQHAAGEGARAAVVGSHADAVEAAFAAGGAGATVTVSGGYVRVCVPVRAVSLVPASERCATAREQT
jgi:hypothetical protein